MFPRIAKSTKLTKGPRPDAMLLNTALMVYKELQHHKRSISGLLMYEQALSKQLSLARNRQRGVPRPDAMLLSTALMVYKELQHHKHSISGLLVSVMSRHTATGFP